MTVAEVDLLEFDDLFLHKEVWNGCEGGCEGAVDGLLAGAALADVSGVVSRKLARQAQQETASYEQYLLELAEREVPGSGEHGGSAAAARFRVAAGERVGRLGPEAAAGEGGAAVRASW